MPARDPAERTHNTHTPSYVTFRSVVGSRRNTKSKLSLHLTTLPSVTATDVTRDTIARRTQRGSKSLYGETPLSAFSLFSLSPPTFSVIVQHSRNSAMRTGTTVLACMAAIAAVNPFPRSFYVLITIMDRTRRYTTLDRYWNIDKIAQ